jgi:hypothetical protein
MLRFWFRARREGSKRRSVLIVREQVSAPSNTALGQKMSVLKRVLGDGGAPVVLPLNIF